MAINFKQSTVAVKQTMYPFKDFKSRCTFNKLQL